MKIAIRVLIVLLLLQLGNSLTAAAQGERKFVQFSGFIIDSKTEEALPGAYIHVVNAGRGTISNSKGYFILNVFPGDSLMFSFLGFAKQYHIVPRDVTLNYSAVVEMQEDAKMLREVRVYPFKTEEEFKRALVEMKLPNQQERQILEETFSPDNVSRMIALQAMSADGNYRFAMNQQLRYLEQRGTMTVNPLTNPFAWMNFIKTVKSGGIKDQSWKGYVVPREKGGRDAIIRGSKN